MESIGVVATILILLYGLRYTIKHFKITKTTEYIQRLNQPSMAEARASIDKWLLLEKPEKEKIDIIYKDHDLMSKMKLFYNLLTEVAIAYEHGILNKKMVKDLWFPVLPRYASLIKPWIAAQRNRGEDIGHSLERVANAILAAHNRSSWDSTDNKQTDCFLQRFLKRFQRKI